MLSRLQQAETQSIRRWDPRKIRRLHLPVITLVLSFNISSAVCQQVGQSKFDATARRNEMFHHLQTIITYRRACVATLQKTGVPTEALYRDQAEAYSLQAFTDAFDWARAEASFIEVSGGGEATTAASSATSEQEKLRAFQRDLDGRVKGLQGKIEELDAASTVVDKQTADANKHEKKRLQSSIEFLNAMKDASQHVYESVQSGGGVGWVADVNALQHSAPELQGNAKKAPSPSSAGTASGDGIVSQIERLARLIGTRSTIRELLRHTEGAHKEAEELRGPITAYANGLMQKSEDADLADAAQLNSYTAQIKYLSSAAVPLSQEILALEKNRNNLASWQAAADGEYRETVHSLFLRILVILGALAAIFVLGELWVRITQRYVRDQKRRRQFLMVRRVIAGTLSVFVVILGFISDFSSLATFAGFVTAGLAVGLQTLLLSVAAYFFIIGRYGIKIGDRVTIASVTGEVIDVGPVRFYLMELTDSGAELMPTGRVAVFSNAVLFQAGTPLYKQIPGSSYSWRELTVTLATDADHDRIREAVVNEVEKVVSEYKPELERQHAVVQNWLQATIGPPEVESRLLITNGTLIVWVRFPVEIRSASQTDEQLTKAMRLLIASQPEIRNAVTSLPLLRPSVKG